MKIFSKKASALLDKLREEHCRISEFDEGVADALSDRVQDLWYDVVFRDDEHKMPTDEVADLVRDVAKRAEKGQLVIAEQGGDMYIWFGAEEALLFALRSFLKDARRTG